MDPNISNQKEISKLLGQLADSQKHQPETFRLPRSGTRDPYFGITRTGWNQLILHCAANGYAPPVLSTVVKSRGAKRGIRLISFSSAKEYFLSLMEPGRSPGARTAFGMGGEPSTDATGTPGTGEGATPSK